MDRHTDNVVALANVAMAAVLIMLLAMAMAKAQDGHSLYHSEFYQQLKRGDGFNCCNDQDCRPTEGRVVGDHYEVLVRDEYVPDGVWLRYEPGNVVKRPASPDGGWHVCAPKQFLDNAGKLYCMVMPQEV